MGGVRKCKKGIQKFQEGSSVLLLEEKKKGKVDGEGKGGNDKRQQAKIILRAKSVVSTLPQKQCLPQKSPKSKKKRIPPPR